MQQLIFRFRLFNVFTLDVIARCAFGMAVDHTMAVDKHTFVRNAKTIFNLPVNRTPLAVIPSMKRMLY